jgi:D-glycero-D-manno-heptose 1,7-bisphosphate phosphatase
LTTRRLALLDRDGTLTVERGFVTDPADLELLPGAAAAVRRLRALGLGVAVVSNQSAVGRGLMSLDDLAAVTARLLDLLSAEGAELDGVYVCVHAPEDGCACRKPKAALLARAASELSGDLTRSFVIGDSARDVEAGRAAGAFTILVRTGHGESALAAGATADRVAADVAEAVDAIAELLSVR